jgi:tRNA pseudouridine55 synthase
VIAKESVPSRENVEKILPQFTGEIMQAPPLYSAIHIDGKRASNLARSGQAPVMKKRPVTVYKLELRCWEPPFADIFVRCSSGTYIRSLARDIALAAGSRAHLTSLVRTQVAGFRLEDAVTVNREQGAGSGEGECLLRPVDKDVISALELPWFDISPDSAQNIIHGKPLDSILDSLTPSSAPPHPDFTAAVFAGETLLAIIERKSDKWLYRCVLN